MAQRKYFGTDGVRGEVGKHPISPDFVLKLGYAAGRVLVKADSPHPTVLIGKDTRVSGYMLEAARQAGFTAAGGNVRLTGPLPTPGIAYLTRALRLDAGVVISASHNPYSDNGIKFFAAGGNKLDDALEAEIEALIDAPMDTKPSRELGRAKRIDTAADRYIEFCKSTFPNEFDLRGLRIVVDCAHGATYHIAPSVFHELGAQVIATGAAPNGFNINDGCGATHPRHLQAAVLQHDADIGVALDGDGDRLIMVDNAGRVYDGDQLIYVIARARMQRGELQGSGVVGTVMTNLGMELALQNRGIEFARSRVGDRYVLEMLKARGWLLGGEASGHILCLDKHSTGDGIVSALQVFAAMKTLDASLETICRDWQPFPQTMINVRVQKGTDWKPATVAPMAAAEQALAGRGRVVLRPSGTEPVIRVMVEADDAELAARWAREIANAIETAAHSAA